jgi:hypothetical protein
MHADRRRQRYFLLREHERPRQGELHALRDDLHAVGGGDAGKRQGKFVAARAGHPIIDVAQPAIVLQRTLSIPQA